MGFFSEEELTPKHPLEGISLKSVFGDNAMMTIFDFEPGAVIPVHTHPHEQITYVVEGEIEFTLEGETRVLRPGDGIVITADREHGAKVMNGPAKAVDAWYPVREDYK